VSYLKAFCFFKPEGMVIARDQTGASQLDLIIYKSIRCLNLFSVDSLYFKTNKSGYAFFFKAFDPNDAHRWCENLIALIDKDIETKAEIKAVDISSSFGVLMLDSEETNYVYYYGKTMQRLEKRHSSVESDRISLP
jgi:hypothetical protein